MYYFTFKEVTSCVQYALYFTVFHRTIFLRNGAQPIRDDDTRNYREGAYSLFALAARLSGGDGEAIFRQKLPLFTSLPILGRARARRGHSYMTSIYTLQIPLISLLLYPKHLLLWM